MRSAKISCIALIYSLVLSSAAQAQPPFFEKFQDLYGKNFQGKSAETKCNICHVKGEPKKVHNEYGLALKKAGLSKELAKNLKTNPQPANKAIEDAFKKVEEEKAKDGRKFGERIKAGDLPASDDGLAE